MPKDYFHESQSAALATVGQSGKIHIIGVSGVAMAQLACVLAAKGYQVSGSDSDFWEPMGSILKHSSVQIHKGYEPEYIPSDVQLVVIGNAIRYENPEVAAVEQRAYPYSFFPKLLFELIIQGRHSIVISGTHGKTTTTALGAHVLKFLGHDPSWFFGGASEQFAKSLHQGSGHISIVEGDEYDSAFFAKLPKFMFYKPDTLIVTSVEFDHADIYPNLESVEKEFTKLVCSMPDSGRVLVCNETPFMRNLILKWENLWHGTLCTYGCEDSKYALLRRSQEGTKQIFEIRDPFAKQYIGTLNLAGAYNVQNAIAVFAACQLCNLPAHDILEGIASFKGVKRRQELWGTGSGITLIEDFAHHPTAVAKTLEAIREAFPTKRLWAVFEPRSNTTRRNIFEKEYIEALSYADVIAISDVVMRHNDVGVELLKVPAICRALQRKGKKASSFPNYGALKNHIISEAQANDVIVMMSNGSFGGIIPELADLLKTRL